LTLQALRDDIGMFARYALGLRGFLKNPLDTDACHRLIEGQRARREGNFLTVLERGVFSNPNGPYLKLFRHAGIELGDVEALIRETGLDATLATLYDAGVRVSLDEVKLKHPVRRGSLEFATTERDWDNPLPARHIEGRSGGSRSAGRRTVVDLDHLTDAMAEGVLYWEAFDLAHCPEAIWYPAPPGIGGLTTVLSTARLKDSRTDRWFSQTAVGVRHSRPRDLLLTATTVAAGRLWSEDHIPWPEHAPLDNPAPVVRWLADEVRGGARPILITFPSAAVLACTAALEDGVDISGTTFLVSGEPYTAEKAQVVDAAGARGLSAYGLTETGTVGTPCARPSEPDDVHLLTHRFGVIQRPVRIGESHVDALFLTTLMPSSPKLMINVESGDYGVIEERSCGCAFEGVGLTRHLSRIRSHEKLTSQGMTFLGDDLVALVDRVLPARFGGSPQDYQIVEEERDGVPRVAIVVNPRLGELDPADIQSAAIEHLAGQGVAPRMMAEVWKSKDALRVERRTPYVTAGGKVLPLHVPSPATGFATRR
jgi:hypothetical protein